MILKEQLAKFISQPFDPYINFNLALCYDEIGQTTSAYSYYLRAAEYSSDDNLVYDSLLRSGMCLAKQNSRHRKAEKGQYLHALNLLPNRPEAYYILSQFYEIEKNWPEAYSIANLGILLNSDQPANHNANYPGFYGLIFQKAVSAWWVGREEECKVGIDLLMNNYEHLMTDFFKELVHENYVFLHDGTFPVLPYTSLVHHKLKYQFENSNIISKNYSQTYQDMFVLTMHNGKFNGTYLEIGSADPFVSNNTALLETKFGWNGISIDINESEIEKFKNQRKNQAIVGNALYLDYDKILSEAKIGSDIDYLQLDCDPPSVTYDILSRMPFDKYRFGVITYEHDFYADDTKLYRDKSRQFLSSKGYKLVGSNISFNDKDSFEDWWVHPLLIDKQIIKKLQNTTNDTKKASSFMLNM